MPVILLVLFLLVALFCIFGFLASFEPGIGVGWKIGYAIAFFASLGFGILCLRSRCKNDEAGPG